MAISTSPSGRIPAEERLFSLVLALIATEIGLTKNDILSSVQGYRQRFEPDRDNSSLERQFERDKDDIRELGIPLETLESPDAAGNNQLLRYRIPKGAYDLPADITFSPQEMTLLTLAAAVWREGSLSAESRRALMKLRSLGIEADEPLVGYAPQIRTVENSFEPLRNALERHVLVRFPYLKPGESVSQWRTIAPRALVQHHGNWHVTGVDQDRAERRTFLLTRIIGDVTVTNTTFLSDERDFAREALGELDRLWSENIAEVEVSQGTDAEYRLRHRGERLNDDHTQAPTERIQLSLHFVDLNTLADELASFGPEVRVVSPPELRDAVRQRLARTLALHQSGGDND